MFDIAREPASLTYEAFRARYFLPERPVLIEGLAADWPARRRWTRDYLRQALAEEPSAKPSSLWYWLDRGALEGDYETPAIVSALYAGDGLFPRTANLRIWLHRQGNVSPWHFDTNMVNVFNAQVVGRKEWFLLSPHTPLACYPFSFYGLIDGRGEHLGARHVVGRVMVEEGDVLYVPPCWFHRVVAHSEDNISFNWVMTKTATTVDTPAMRREAEIYAIQHFFRRHPSAAMRKAFDIVYACFPDFLRFRWRYERPMASPYHATPGALWLRLVKELGAVGPMLRHGHRALSTLKQVSRVEPLSPPH